MTIEESGSIGRARPPRVAPWWHTAVMVGLFAVLTAGGVRYQHAALSHHAAQAVHPPVLPLYLWLLVLEWGLLYYVWKAGLRRTGTRIGDLVRGRWARTGDVLRDVAVAIAIWGTWEGILFGWGRLVGADHAASIGNLLPRGPIEISLWIAVSISAGICEEIVFRGYLQRQFEALTGLPWLAMILQAAVFGVSHGYQGVMACLRIALYAVLFTLVAKWRRSLRPGILAHALTDVLAGAFRV
jgi:CAAX protease family protein